MFLESFKWNFVPRSLALSQSRPSRFLLFDTRSLQMMRDGSLVESLCTPPIDSWVGEVSERREPADIRDARGSADSLCDTHTQERSNQIGPANSMCDTPVDILGEARGESGSVESLFDTQIQGVVSHIQEGGGQTSPVESFVIVYNVAKRHNIGTLARSATAFGVSEMILVGKHKDFNAFGSHGAAAHLRYRHFFTLVDARSHLKEKGCDIIGVEITDGAMPVHTHPFNRSTAFLLGNEGTGLSDKEMAICDSFIYIAQYGCGTASLNVTVAASIVLHHFAVWAGYFERPRAGQKFVVAERPSKQMQRIICTETPEMIAEMRRLKQCTLQDWLRDVEQHDGEDLNSDRGQGLTSNPLETSSALTKLFED